jgi:hypothetical protein
MACATFFSRLGSEILKPFQTPGSLHLVTKVKVFKVVFHSKNFYSFGVFAIIFNRSPL